MFSIVYWAKSGRGVKNRLHSVGGGVKVWNMV